MKLMACAILASVCEAVRSSYIDQIEGESTQSTLFNTPDAPLKKTTYNCEHLSPWLRWLLSRFTCLEDRLCCLGGWKEASEVGKTGCLNSGASAKRYLSS